MFWEQNLIKKSKKSTRFNLKPTEELPFEKFENPAIKNIE